MAGRSVKVLFSQQAAPLMVEQGTRGRVISVSSTEEINARWQSEMSSFFEGRAGQPTS